MTLLHTDVLIVGAGPVGLATALMFQKLGVSCIVVERRAGLHTAPQAHVISSRTMEICRGLGINDGEIRALGPNPMDTAHVRWVDHLLGRDLGVFAMVKGPEDIGRMFAMTPTPTGNVSQDQFERVLAGHLSDATELLFEHAWKTTTSNAHGYLSHIEGGGGASIQVQSKYIIGADGAGSAVRRFMGVHMDGPDAIQNYVTVHFHGNLRSQLQGRTGLLYWVMDPDAYGCFIAHNIDGNWIYMKTLGADAAPEGIDEAHYEQLLKRAIGADVDIDIQSMSTWRMSAQVADQYQKDGIFLVGDAAHRFPPTGGLGLNTGFQDAHNLTWKIAMVLNGCGAGLLDTYEIERRPSALSNSQQSYENFLKMTEVDAALGYNGAAPSAADFDAILADPDRQAAVQVAVERQAKHFNMTGFDLGVCYQSDAIADDGPAPVPENPVSQYIPSTTPGARLPHCWVRQGEQRVSTLDLVRSDAWRLVCFSASCGGANAAAKSLAEQDVPIEAVSVELPSDGTGEMFNEDEALVVRPDGHIAARLPASASAQQAMQTLQAVAQW
ncbi:MAG: FAD-dependent monooxygenase [Pseudomonadota bacterium]